MELTIASILALGIIYIVLLLTILILWISTLVYQAKRNQWVWFVLTLLFGIVMLIYWIAWIFNPKLKRRRK